MSRIDGSERNELRSIGLGGVLGWLTEGRGASCRYRRTIGPISVVPLLVLTIFNWVPLLSRAEQTAIPSISGGMQSIFDGSPPKSVDDLRAMQRHMTELAKAVAECTVSVQFGSAHGSGVIVSEDGYILTVAHVVGEPDRDVSVRMQDGLMARGRSLGMHMELDAGLVKLSGNGPWPHLKMAKAPEQRVGQWCAAVGHPGGFDLPRGPVFRLGRILSSGDLIRTDCPLIGGDSGGPLVDMKGSVIGIHSRIGVSVVNNLHVPISVYEQNWDGLVAGQRWESRAFIGVRGEEEDSVARVALVRDDSPAAQAGIQVGDIVTLFDGNRIHDFPQLVQLVRQKQPGETVRVRVRREDQILDLDVTIGKRDDHLIR